MEKLLVGQSPQQINHLNQTQKGSESIYIYYIYIIYNINIYIYVFSGCHPSDISRNLTTLIIFEKSTQIVEIVETTKQEYHAK